jgi:hypothetical protein
MSYPLIGGRLREGTSGVDRPQAAFECWGIGPREGDWSDLCLDVIVRRRATSDRRMVTAAKYVYSTWQFHSQPGEKHGEALYRNRSASQRVHLLPAIRKRQKLLKPVAAGRSAALCEEVAGQRRTGDGTAFCHVPNSYALTNLNRASLFHSCLTFYIGRHRAGL